ncbi:26474_t:CDS:2 [Gigaspora margarita]|uniref:26474_t:CDS:1 n=1 Tax=Gigaspora margarita TaxID=4874 RepID=A0ABM8W4E4_GIGMA|nr:26474_t:CDS:2 [Gigaspora margarita]
MNDSQMFAKYLTNVTNIQIKKKLVTNLVYHQRNIPLYIIIDLEIVEK